MFRALGKVAEIIEADNKADIVCCFVFFDVVNFTNVINFNKKKTFYQQLFRDLIPSMVNVIQQCLEEGDSDSAIKGFELFDGLLLLVCKCNSL